jgi:hypothetical protein
MNFGFSTAGRPRGWNIAWYYWLLLIIVLISLFWVIFNDLYYEQIIKKTEKVKIVIFCHTGELNSGSTKAVILYDKLALTPIARWLSLFQNRDPSKVNTFFPVKIPNTEITPVSVTITNVHTGPITKVLLISNGQKYHISMQNANKTEKAFYLHAQP